MNPERFSDAGAGDAGGDAGAPRLCVDPVRSILLSRCATSGCHAADMPSAGLDLQSPNHRDRLRGQAATGGVGLIIDAANPDKSALYLKLLDPPPWKDRMPLRSEPLSMDEARCLLEWIAPPTSDAGASDAFDGGASD